MKRIWGNERGSTLLLLVAAIAVFSILFGAIYAGTDYFHKRTLTNDLQLQAEYNAEKMMELATYYYYKDINTFQATIPDCNGNSHYTDPDGTGSSVCLQGGTELVATGLSHGYNVGLQQVTIKVNLSTLSAPGGNTGGTGGTGGSGGTGGTGGSGGSQGGEPCSDSSTNLPMRALVMGTDFRGDLVDKDNQVDHLLVYGGFYVGNGKSLWLDHDYKTVNLNGWNYAEGGLQWAQGSGNNAPDYPHLGDNSQEDTRCTNLGSYHSAMLRLANHVLTTLTQVPVYQFDGTQTGGVHLNTIGYKRPANMANFDTLTTYTLAQVLASSENKIVLIKGDLVLDKDTANQTLTNLTATGFLIVYNPNPSMMSTLYMPDNLNLTLQGALAFEQMGEISTDKHTDAMTKTANAWPYGYIFNVNLTDQEEGLYQQF